MKRLLSILMLTLPLSAHSLTLNEATEAAVQNAHDIKILKLQMESSSLNKIKSYSAFLPKIELDGRHLFQERFEELEVPFGETIFVMPAIQPYTTLGFTAKWNVFNGFKDIHQMNAAIFERTAAEKALERALDEKKIQIRSLFSKALASQILVSVINENIEALQNHLKDINIRIRSGVSTRYDLLRSEVQLEEAKTDKIAAENNVADSRAQLFKALGIADDGKPLQGDLTTEFNKFNETKKSVQLQERDDRAALIAQKDRLTSLSKASRSHWMPSVSLFGNYEWYNNINHSITESDQRFKSAYGLGVMFSWNPFDGGADWAEHKKALIDQQIAEERVSQFDQDLPAQIDEIQNRFHYDVVNYKSKLNTQQKAEEAVRLAKGELRAGTRTNSEILDAIVGHNRARAALIKAQLQAIEDLGQLELALGSRIL